MLLLVLVISISVKDGQARLMSAKTQTTCPWLKGTVKQIPLEASVQTRIGVFAYHLRGRLSNPPMNVFLIEYRILTMSEMNTLE